MSQHDDDVRLRHMLDAARQAIAFARGRERPDLDQDVQLALALTRLVEIIGEARRGRAAQVAPGADAWCGVDSSTIALSALRAG